MIKLPRAVGWFFIFSIAGLLVYLSLKNVGKQKQTLMLAFSEANYLWVVASVAVSILSHVLRAIRWNMLLAPTGFVVRPWASTACVLAGYFSNYGIPRMGEVVRCSLAYKYDGVPVERGLASVIVERAVDVLLLVLISLLALLFQFDVLKNLLSDFVLKPLSQWLDGAWLGGIVILILGLVLIYTGSKIIKSNRFRPMLSNFIDGLRSVFKLQKPMPFIAYSVAIWLCYFFSLYLCFWALPQTSSLGFGAGLVLLIMGTLGVIFSPGGIGAYPLLIGLVLERVYGIVGAPAVALPWISWGSQFVSLLVLGPVSFLLLAVFKKPHAFSK